MSDERQLSRISLRADQLLNIKFADLPEPPPEMMKLPGVAFWWHQMKLSRERDIQSFMKMVVRIQASDSNTTAMDSDNQNIGRQINPRG